MQSKMSFLLIFISAFVLSDSHASRNFLEWYFGSDQWINFPQLKMQNYHEISLTKSIHFYDNIEFKGEPAFTVANGLVSFNQTKESCRPYPRSKKMLVTNWIRCKPFFCEEVKSKTPQEKSIFFPSEREWVSENDVQKKCSIQPEIEISRIRSGDWQLFLILDVAKNGAIYIEDKKFFPDLRFCQKEINLCKFNLKSKDFSFFSYNPQKKLNPLSSYSDIKKCIEPKVNKKCLETYTANSKDLEYLKENYSLSDDVSPIKWTAKKIEELKFCLKEDAAISDNSYMGLDMKCMRLNHQLLVIDYPEAFINNEPLEFDVVEIKAPKK